MPGCAEEAKSAEQRVLLKDPDLVGGTVARLGSFTLAATEVAERAGGGACLTPTRKRRLWGGIA